MIVNLLKERAQKTHAQEVVQTANDAISRFGELIETNSGTVMDEIWLPLNKDGMKTAFEITISVETDPQQIEMLRAGYVMLAHFQQTVGNVPIDLPKLQTDFNPEYRAATDRRVKATKVMADDSQTLLVEIREWMRARKSTS